MIDLAAIRDLLERADFDLQSGWVEAARDCIGRALRMVAIGIQTGRNDAMDTQTNAPTFPRLAYTIAEIAAFTGTSVSTVARGIRRGEIKTVKIGCRSRISAAELARLLDSRAWYTRLPSADLVTSGSDT